MRTGLIHKSEVMADGPSSMLSSGDLIEIWSRASEPMTVADPSLLLPEADAVAHPFPLGARFGFGAFLRSPSASVSEPEDDGCIVDWDI
jgi:hypothetical protein